MAGSRPTGRHARGGAMRNTAVLAALGCVFAGCSFSTTAKDWNELKGFDDRPTYFISATKVGLKLFVIVPFLGDMGISGLTRDMTKEVKKQGGNEVRIVQGTEESYFYGFPPFTWVITPVISTVSAEYIPDPAVYADDQEAITRHNQRGWWGKWYMPWRW